METTTAGKTAMQVMIDMYDWHTNLFKNAIDGISDKDAQNRMNTKANHIAWIAGSMVQQRYLLAKFTDLNLKQTSDELFTGHKGIQENVTYPLLAEFKKDWETVSPVLRNALLKVSADKLQSPDPFGMGENMNFFDSIVACTDRESYCIGQIGLWRRLLGYEAMKYS
jgi:hypothetical protein